MRLEKWLLSTNPHYPPLSQCYTKELMLNRWSKCCFLYLSVNSKSIIIKNTTSNLFVKNQRVGANDVQKIIYHTFSLKYLDITGRIKTSLGSRSGSPLAPSSCASHSTGRSKVTISFRFFLGPQIFSEIAPRGGYYGGVPLSLSDSGPVPDKKRWVCYLVVPDLHVQQSPIGDHLSKTPKFSQRNHYSYKPLVNDQTS